MTAQERIDHAAEARLHATADPMHPSAAASFALAQVHATLALAEQQRIANLIALGMYTNADGSRLAQHAVAHPINGYDVAINDDIQNGLGL